MRRGILIVVALGTLAGCRDFQVPPLGYQGPLKVVPATLAVAPQEAATFQVEGGTPPYTVGPAPGSTTGSTGGTDYLAFPLTANGGSGGFAAVNGAQVDYAAGTGDTTAGQHTRDSFVVRDAKGATVTVHVDIGPPVAVDFGNAGKPLSVPPGGTLFLGATGGKGPYLFGLASAPSDGLADAVTGRYRAGDLGCVTDTLVVRDDVGATDADTVNVQCPRMPGSPADVVAARALDLGSTTNRVFYFTTRNGGDLELPIYGGAPYQVSLPGPVVAVTAPRHAPGVVVAVREFDGIHLLSANGQPGAFVDLVATGPNYPIPLGSTLRLTSAENFTSTTSPEAEASWTTPTGGGFAAHLAVGQSTGAAVSVPGQPAAVTGFPATLHDFLNGRTDFVQLYLPQAGGQVAAVVDIGGGLGGQTPVTVPVTFQTLLDAAGSDGSDVALLGTDASGNRVLALVSLNTSTGAFSLQGGPVPVQGDADRVVFGHLRSLGSEDYVVAGAAGEVRLVHPDGNGALKVENTSWFLPAGITDLAAGDVDGDGLDELLASGDPAGDPAIYVNPSALPLQAPPSRGVYGHGALQATSVGKVVQPQEVPTVLALDQGRFADGSDSHHESR